MVASHELRFVLPHCSAKRHPRQLTVEAASRNRLARRPRNVRTRLKGRLTNERNNFMELSPSPRAHSFPATQEVTSNLGDVEIKYHVHKTPPMGPILSYMNPGHILTSYLFEIHFNIILPSKHMTS
jgi:hypothetical protein